MKLNKLPIEQEHWIDECIIKLKSLGYDFDIKLLNCIHGEYSDMMNVYDGQSLSAYYQGDFKYTETILWHFSGLTMGAENMEFYELCNNLLIISDHLESEKQSSETEMMFELKNKIELK